MVEGRQGGARKDGPLHLNTRGGAEVVIGNAESRSGVEVFGALFTDPGAPGGGAVASAFRGDDELVEGDVVRVNDGDPSRVSRASRPGDRSVIGVVCTRPAVLLGGPLRTGFVAVAVQGVSPVRVAGPHPGHAVAVTDPAASAGAIIGKALEGLETGRGVVRALIGGR